MVRTCHHPWTVTAPWYAWPLAGVPASGRGTRPLLQKFASDDFVNAYVRDPQRSLEFDADADQVYTAQFIQADPGRFAGRIAALFPARDAAGTPLNKGDATTQLRKARLVGTGLRKLYLPSHGRHYVVACELHCDVPGLPPPGPGTVCQAGFVVRRRRLGATEAQHPEALQLLRAVVQAQAALGDLDEAAPLRPGLAKARASRNARLRAQGRFDSERSAAQAAVDQARAALQAWQLERGIRSFKEGWFPGAQEGVGEWRELLDETPQQIEEAWVRLVPLVADPRDANHAARGRALFYGIVPTSAFETTVGGEARFDDRCTYELRCVFRQHEGACPFPGLNNDAPDCGGALVWSEASEPYRLAAQFDLQGSANRPVTIQMPDLAELAAQAMARPIGRFSPVRFVHAQQLSSQTDGAIPTSGRIGGPAVCFFSIPLITIVASFVLNLFLPIVVLIFNLWFLLALRFCIPPSFAVEGGLQAELSVIPPKLNVDAELEIDVDAPGWQWNGQDGAGVRTALAGEMAQTISRSLGVDEAKVEPELLKYSNAPLVSLAGVLFEKSQQKAQPDGSVPGGLDRGSGLVWRARRISQWKFETQLPTTGEYA